MLQILRGLKLSGLASLAKLIKACARRDSMPCRGSQDKDWLSVVRDRMPAVEDPSEKSLSSWFTGTFGVCRTPTERCNLNKPGARLIKSKAKQKVYGRVEVRSLWTQEFAKGFCAAFRTWRADCLQQSVYVIQVIKTSSDVPSRPTRFGQPYRSTLADRRDQPKTYACAGMAVGEVPNNANERE